MAKDNITILVGQQAILIDGNGAVHVIKLKPSDIPDIHANPNLIADITEELPKKEADAINPVHEDLFNKFWESWPTDRRTRKPDCRAKFLSICKNGNVEKFMKAVESYSNYLYYQKTHRNFDQQIKFTSTFMNQWKEWFEKDIGYVEPL